ncbi:MAG: phosphoribosylformylglycinamidine synthase subunit PurL, partial [Pseudomonadota bacterium]
ARPVAAMNALRFGAPDHPKTKHLVAGVVAGVGGYGNSFGVPTVGGEVEFDARYNGNILVNAFAAGLVDADKIFYSKARGVGLPVVYLGAKTGRDGVGGATMASAEFGDDIEEKRPTVQVGDPFTEKLLIEACLELMASDAIVAIQDMGAAGLTSSSVEMASKGGVGIRLDLDKVPCRETGMTPYEMMLSESQERMLMVLKPGREAFAEAIFKKWELDFAVIGEVVEGGDLTMTFHGEVVGRIPLDPLADAAPKYDRPHVPTPKRAPLTDVPASASIVADLKTLMGSADLCSRRWIWEQYDNQVGADTLQRPGGDAAVVRVHGTKKALAIATDCTPRYCFADPHEGGKQAVAETWRNIVAVGGKPLAITNCLNFASPQNPVIMGQLVGCIEGMAEACRALDYPVVSGNVSLYNESKATGGGNAILPTPAIGGVGVLTDYANQMDLAFKSEGEAIWLIGGNEASLGTHLGQSLWLRECHGREDGPPPAVDLARERANGERVAALIAARTVTAVHDLSDGGLATALADMALASGMGAVIDATLDAAAAFGEDQGRYLVTAPAGDAIAGATRIGTVGGDALVINGETLALADLKRVHEAALPAMIAG